MYRPVSGGFGWTVSKENIDALESRCVFVSMPQPAERGDKRPSRSLSLMMSRR